MKRNRIPGIIDWDSVGVAFGNLFLSALTKIVDWVNNVFKATIKTPEVEPEIIERRLFTIHSGWGHHIEWREDFSNRKVWGHLPDLPEAGDYLEAEMKSGRKAIFRFVSVDRQRDPPDMFFGKVEDVGYRDEIDCEALGVPTEEHKTMFL